MVKKIEKHIRFFSLGLLGRYKCEVSENTILGILPDLGVTSSPKLPKMGYLSLKCPNISEMLRIWPLKCITDL